MAILNFFPGGGGGKDIRSATINLDSTTLTYNGNEQTKNITSVVYNGITLVENTDYVIVANSNKQTNAGTYTLTIAGIQEYSGTCSKQWTIAKKSATITASPSSIVFSSVGDTVQVTLTTASDGAITATSKNTSVVTVGTVSSKKFTATAVAQGDTTISVALAAGTNYKAKTITVAVSFVSYSSVLSENSPEQIQLAINSGAVVPHGSSSIWAIGDSTKLISIGAFDGISATSACAYIIGFDHNSSVEGTGVTFLFGKSAVSGGKDIAFASAKMNDSATNSGGWSSSRMRNTTCSAFYSALPSTTGNNWQGIIANTTKWTDNQGGPSLGTLTSTSDKIFLLSEYEVHGSTYFATNEPGGKQVQYAYYANGNSVQKFSRSATSTSIGWWNRSCAYYQNITTTHFCHVNSASTSYGWKWYESANSSLGFAPAFRVAKTT